MDILERKLTGIQATRAAETYPTPGALAVRITPKTVQTPALDLIDAELVRLSQEPDQRLIITMPPQEGKSVRVSHDFVLWWLTEVNPDARVVVASYGQKLANRNGRAIRNSITTHPELQLQIAADNGSAAEWQLAGRTGGVLSVGVGTGFTGRPCDLLVIDDPIKNQKEADSETFRENVWDWWQAVGSARLGPGAPVVVILTRWHTDDLAGRLLAEPDSEWRVLNIPAQADHNPDRGESDVLDRAPGEYMESARGRSSEQWERRKREAGSRTWAALYQGRPSPAEGNVIHRDWWRYYDTPLWVELANGAREIVGDYQGLLTSWDLTFKDTKGSDYVVGQVWMRRGANAYLLDQVRGRWSFTETCRQMIALAARWPQALLHIVEDKANGPAVMAALRSTIPGLVPEEPQGSKLARLSAASPLVEAGNVLLPNPSSVPGTAWVPDFVEEIAGFPTAKHDDQADGFSQAMNRLFLQPLLTDARPVYAQEYEAIDRRGWYASPV